MPEQPNTTAPSQGGSSPSPLFAFAAATAQSLLEEWAESAKSHHGYRMCPECLRIEAFGEDHQEACRINNAIKLLIDANVQTVATEGAGESPTEAAQTSNQD